MKTCLLSLLLFSLAAHAAEKRKQPPAEEKAPTTGQLMPAATPVKVEDYSNYKTADALWQRLNELRENPKVQPKSREEYIAIFTDWFRSQKKAADAFIARYPRDARHYGAELVSLQCGLQLSRVPGGSASGPAADPAAVKKKLAEIVAAPDAPEDVKGEASFVQTIALSGEVEREKPETIARFFKASDEYLAKYGSHKLASQMRIAQLQLAGTVDTPEAHAILAKLSTDGDSSVADAAKQTVTRQQKMAELKTKPVDLKFTSTDGHEVNLESLRGKVVLVDFWASWCGPCIAEMPNVVSTYGKLHDKGFEIVGISLDQERAPMDAALKKFGMTWQQYFDGKGWKNEIATNFGITAIPAAWLIDKKGMLRSCGLRGEALGVNVEKLLGE